MTKKERIIEITDQISRLVKERDKLKGEMRSELPLKEGDAVSIVYHNTKYSTDAAFINRVFVENTGRVEYTFNAVNKNGERSKHSFRPSSFLYRVDKR